MFGHRSLQEAAARKYATVGAIVIALVILWAPHALAQVNPPSWWGAQNDNTVSLCYHFDQDAWPPTANTYVVPAWYAGSVWTKDGPKMPQWTAQVTNHTGVWGLADGSAGEGTLAIKVDNLYRENWVKHVWFQFDVYLASGEMCVDESTDLSGVISEKQTTSQELSYGWQRVTGTFVVKPQPEWEKLVWTLTASQGGIVVIDNVCVGSHCEPVPEPSSLAVLAMPLLGLAAAWRRRW